jgi:hypothetical protein
MAETDPKIESGELTNVPGVSTASTLGDVPPVSPAQTPAPGAPIATGHTVHAQPGDEEIVYFDGSPTPASVAGKLTVHALVGLVLLSLPFLYHRFSGSHGWPIWWLSLSMVVIALLLPLLPLARLKTIRYRITNYRIDYERGIGSRDIDTLELWHVEDIHLHQSLWGRMLNFGAIAVESRDETLPKLTLVGVPNARTIFETLKQRVIAVKRQRGVIKMDPG